MHKFNWYLSTLLVIVGSFTQCQNSTPYEYELDNAADRCGGIAATLLDLISISQEGLDSLAVHIKNAPAGSLKKAGRLGYQRSLQLKYSLQESADSLAAHQVTCADWKKKLVQQKATALLHALLDLNGDIEEWDTKLTDSLP